MSLFADICRNEDAEDRDVALDATTGRWVVKPHDWQWLFDCPTQSIEIEIPGIPTKEMALAIVRAIRAAYETGYNRAVDSYGYS